MADYEYRLLSLKSTADQVLWLGEQSDEKLLELHRKWGYGATECNCDEDTDPPPCPLHGLSRFQLIARACAAGHKFQELSSLPDDELFDLVFPYEGQGSCDCPALYPPCEHALAAFDSPLSDEAMRYLAQLVNGDYRERPEAPTRIWARARPARALKIERRAERGFDLWRDDDSKIDTDDRLERLAQVVGKRNRNGSDGRPGRVVVRRSAAA